jgi:hypothetical protein
VAAKTLWGPAPWLREQTWLLKDNTVVKTPLLEATSSGRRIRIAGQTQSFPKNELDSLQFSAVREVAVERGTEPWVQITNTPDDTMSFHGAASPERGGTPDFSVVPSFHYSDPKRINQYDHTQITFEFVSEECATLTAVVWVYIGKGHYNSDFVLRSGITYRAMNEKAGTSPGSGYSWFNGDQSKWYTPFGYYDSGDYVEDAQEFLGALEPIPGVEFVNKKFDNNARGAALEALKLLKQLIDVERITLPVWRDKTTPEAMIYRATGRTNFANSLYREMLEFVQTRATVERIKENFAQIHRDMAQLGMVMRPARTNSFFETVEQGFGDGLLCHMIPLTTDGNGNEATQAQAAIVEDHEHTVSIDFASGTLVVNCLKAENEGLVEQWDFARMKAELHGELDAFLGFATQAKNKRQRRRVNKIVKDRSTDEDDLEISKFSSAKS